jgi:hypothetical protein
MALNFTLHLPSYYPAFFNLPLTRTVETEYVVTKIYPTFYKHMAVEFSIPMEWGNCKFDIYKSASETGPWAKITPTPIVGPFFIDVTTEDYSMFDNTWYVVECMLPDGRRIQGPVTTWQNKRGNWVQLRAKEIQRRETLLLEKFTGVDTLLFRRKHYGMRCKRCWDFATEKTTQDHCPNCLGTSFEGGYFPGFKTLLQYEPTPNDAVLDYRGRVENNTLSAWTVSWPQIELFDVVLRVPDWKIYRVDHILSTELQTVPVRQVLSLTELPKESVEFKLTAQAMPSNYL